MSYLEYFISHGRLDVNLKLGSCQDVDIHYFPKFGELLLRFYRGSFFDVHIELCKNNNSTKSSDENGDDVHMNEGPLRVLNKLYSGFADGMYTHCQGWF